MKIELKGIEAIALGAIESDVRFVAGYPGSPATTLMDTFVQHKRPGIHVEWSANEKVAFGGALGASVSGHRSMAVLKHVGMNIAADPLLTAWISGVSGGMVVVAGDDPNCHYSQNEQDSRVYGRFADVPTLEPATPQEAREMTSAAFEISERFSIPVILRFIRRLNLYSGEFTMPSEVKEVVVDTKDCKWILGKGSIRHQEVYDMRDEIVEATRRFNSVVVNGSDLCVVTSGPVDHEVKQVASDLGIEDDVSWVRIGAVNPIDQELMTALKGMKRFLVVEEGDPFIETELQTMFGRLRVMGRDSGDITHAGEINIDDVYDSLQKGTGISFKGSRMKRVNLAGDYPKLCTGCPSLSLGYVLKKLRREGDLYVFDGGGCTARGTHYDEKWVDYLMVLGSGLDGAQGYSHFKKCMGIVGDSSFIHTGIQGLINSVYNQADASLVILDNRSTCTTGFQPNPAMGFTIENMATKEIILEDLCRACGAGTIVADGFNLTAVEKAMRDTIDASGTNIVIVKGECPLIEGAPDIRERYRINDKCIRCDICLDLECPALQLEGEVLKIADDCTGCSLCAQLCDYEAVEKKN